MGDTELIELVARAIWERQHNAVSNPGPITAARTWGDNSVPQRFWDEYREDAKAVLALPEFTRLQQSNAAFAEALRKIMEDDYKTEDHHRVGLNPDTIWQATARTALANA